MSDPDLQFKNPAIAAGLAFLIPGAGHFYQRRFFKGVLYSVCILGTFFYGMSLGEWKTVYLNTIQGGVPGNKIRVQRLSFGYLAQVGIGLAALPAILQAKRHNNNVENVPQQTLDAPLSAPFTGHIKLQAFDNRKPSKTVTGSISLEPVDGPFPNDVRGRFTGTLNGEKIELQLAGGFYIDQPIAASTQRRVHCDIVTKNEGVDEISGQLDGHIPRSFVDWFEVPLQDEELQGLHHRLGKYYELALVYTWIAGFLNILAVWDALDGPAYGSGSEPEKEDSASDDNESKPSPEPESDDNGRHSTAKSSREVRTGS